MNTDNEQNDKKLQRLTEAWKYAKRLETDWNQQRIAIESEMYELVIEQLPEKGSYTTETGVKITTGFAEDWDQGILNEVYQQWAGPVPFPFAGVWKADGKAVSYIRDNVPDLYKLLQGALTLKPKKPSFTIKE